MKKNLWESFKSAKRNWVHIPQTANPQFTKWSGFANRKSRKIAPFGKGLLN